MIEIKVAREEEKNRVNVCFACSGGTNELIEELAAGAAHVLVALADDLPAMDELHESFARVFCGMTTAAVGRLIIERSESGQAENEQRNA